MVDCLRNFVEEKLNIEFRPLRNALKGAQGVVAGSSVLHSFMKSKGMNPNFEPGDMDIFVSEKNPDALEKIQKRLLKEGYRAATVFDNQPGAFGPVMSEVDHAKGKIVKWTVPQFEDIHGNDVDSDASFPYRRWPGDAPCPLHGDDDAAVTRKIRTVATYVWGMQGNSGICGYADFYKNKYPCVQVIVLSNLDSAGEPALPSNSSKKEMLAQSLEHVKTFVKTQFDLSVCSSLYCPVANHLEILDPDGIEKGTMYLLNNDQIKTRDDYAEEMRELRQKKYKKRGFSLVTPGNAADKSPASSAKPTPERKRKHAEVANFEKSPQERAAEAAEARRQA